MNVKLGGMNSFINLPFIIQQPAILMGASTIHPPSYASNRPTITALCASMDARSSRYATSIRVQTPRQEIINDLGDMVKEMLKTFYQTCGRKPDRILFYRDGTRISEGQFTQVLENETMAIKGK
jgi:eukaryotic translation initiation factor 2C